MMECHRRESHVRAQRAKPHVFHAGIDVGGQPRDDAGYWVNPRRAVEIERILAAADSERRGRARAGDVLEMNLGQRATAECLFPLTAKLKASRVVRMKNKE